MGRETEVCVYLKTETIMIDGAVETFSRVEIKNFKI